MAYEMSQPLRDTREVKLESNLNEKKDLDFGLFLDLKLTVIDYIGKEINPLKVWLCELRGCSSI